MFVVWQPKVLRCARTVGFQHGRISAQWFASGFKMLIGFASWVPLQCLLTMAGPFCFGPILVTVLTFLTGILTKTYFHSLLFPNRYSCGCFRQPLFRGRPSNILFAQLSLLKATPSAVNGVIILTFPHERTLCRNNSSYHVSSHTSCLIFFSNLPAHEY